MSIKKEQKRNKLSHELLGIFGAVTVVFIFAFFFLSTAAYSIAESYCEKNIIVLS